MFRLLVAVFLCIGSTLAVPVPDRFEPHPIVMSKLDQIIAMLQDIHDNHACNPHESHEEEEAEQAQSDDAMTEMVPPGANEINNKQEAAPGDVQETIPGDQVAGTGEVAQGGVEEGTPTDARAPEPTEPTEEEEAETLVETPAATPAEPPAEEAAPAAAPTQAAEEAAAAGGVVEAEPTDPPQEGGVEEVDTLEVDEQPAEPADIDTDVDPAAAARRRRRRR